MRSTLAPSRQAEGRQMQALRHWSVRHAAGLKRFYDGCARCLPYLDRATRLVGRARSERLLTPLERAAKGLMFDCRECGQCVLSATGMACPMNCAKEMRNGPCGGVRADGSLRGQAGDALRLGRGHRRAPSASPPTTWRSRRRCCRADRSSQTRARSTWIQVIHGDVRSGLPAAGRRAAPSPTRNSARFERACNSGRFVVTVEVAPPDSADPQALLAARPRSSRAWSTPSTSPTAPAATATCPASPPPPFSPPTATRRSIRSPAATATASPSRATSSAPRRWA